MGEAGEYTDSMCEDWADEMDSYLIAGYSWDEAIDLAGTMPLPDCIEYITQEEKR